MLYLVRGDFGIGGYHVQVTDLRTVWEQTLDSTSIKDTAAKLNCRLDISSYADQFRSFMDLLRSNLLSPTSPISKVMRSASGV